MIKASTTTRGGQKLIFLGLSARNLEKLKEGYPILFNAKTLGFDGEVCIAFGETEQHIVDDLKKNGLLPADVEPMGQA